MPSFDAANHSRNYTWPPSLHLLDHSRSSSSKKDETEELHQTHILPDIDEDPFAHFISPVTEEDDPYEEYDFNAGISVSDLPPPNKTKTHKFRIAVAKRWERYLAHHHHSQLQDPQQLAEEDLPTIADEADEDQNTPYPLAIPTIRITHPSSAPYQPPSPSSSPPLLASDTDSSPSSSPPSTIPPYDLSVRPPPSPLPSPSTFRGRFPSSPPPSPGVNIPRRKKGRRRSSRTLSGRRHAWREPSPDLFTVMEGVEMGVLRDWDGDVEMGERIID